MKRRGKIALLCFFALAESFFVLITVVTLFAYLPVGIIGLAVSTFFAIVIISIQQSIKGKKPIIDLFHENPKKRKNAAVFKKQTSSKLVEGLEQRSSFSDYNERRKARREAFFEVMAMDMIIDSLFDSDNKKVDE